MKNILIVLILCGMFITVEAKGAKRRHVQRRRPAPVKVVHEHNYRNNGLLKAFVITGIVNNGISILSNLTTPKQTTVIQQVPVVQKETIIVQPQEPQTQIIQIGNTKYLIYKDANGNNNAVKITD